MYAIYLKTSVFETGPGCIPLVGFELETVLSVFGVLGLHVRIALPALKVKTQQQMLPIEPCA